MLGVRTQRRKSGKQIKASKAAEIREEKKLAAEMGGMALD